MSSYLITGATGYIGSMLIRDLLDEKHGKKHSITALVRDREKAESMLSEQVRIWTADLTDAADMSAVKGKYDYIIHCAAATKSSEMIEKPVEVMEGIVNGTQNVLNLARRCQIAGMVYLSSMEVYGAIDCSDGHRVSEHETGELDPLEIRSCYPQAKRMAETLCSCYCKEYHVPVKIVRLAQTFGKGVAAGESRVFAQFARAAVNRQDIMLHTDGSSMGNYCDIADAIRAIKIVLEKGISGEAYNVVNEENTMTIRQMAEFVAADLTGGEIGVLFDIPKENQYGYAANTGLRLSAKKLMDLGWRPTKNLREMYLDLMERIEKIL